jgi:hypothetical protein
MLTEPKMYGILQDIQKLANEKDYEAAHSLENTLWYQALQEISSGKDHAANLAKIALSTEKIEFPRWFA